MVKDAPNAIKINVCNAKQINILTILFKIYLIFKHVLIVVIFMEKTV